MENNIIVDISGIKSHTRLVFITDNKIVLKITFPYVHFLNETRIHKELNIFLSEEEKIFNLHGNSPVVKIFGSEKVKDCNREKFVFKFDDKQLIIHPNEHQIVYKTISDFLDGIIKKYNVSIFIYSITEYDNAYEKVSNMDFCLKRKDYGNIAFETLKILVYLNKNLGFIHFDLWTDNLLIRKNDFAIKLYDFDKSSTLKNQNFYMLDHFFGEDYTSEFNYTNPNFRWIGLLYDMYRLIQTFEKQPDIDNSEFNEFLENIFEFEFVGTYNDVVGYQSELFMTARKIIEENEKVTQDKTFKELVIELFPEIV